MSKDKKRNGLVVVEEGDTPKKVRAKQIHKAYGVDDLPNLPGSLNSASHAERTLLTEDLPLRNDPNRGPEFREVLKARIQKIRNVENKLESQGFKKIPVDPDSHRARYSKRPFSLKKGDRLLKSLGLIGGAAAAALSSGDASAAIDPAGSETMDYDRAYEPDTVEYQKRMAAERLVRALNARDTEK